MSITGSGADMSHPRRRPIFARRRPSRIRRLVGWLPLGLFVILALTIAAVRSVDDSKPAEAGPVHVHALGVDPEDGSLFIATHTGLFRLPPEQERPERVSDLNQDTMGFTVAGPGHFLGSGHPDLRDDLPPLLGLIESRDAGKSWTSVSLLGEADFHVLRITDRRIVGFDATSSRILISEDGGRTWKDREPPERLDDLVTRPGFPDTFVAAGEGRMFISRDGGVSWRPREGGTGFLAWPRDDLLYRIDPSGRTWASSDAGKRWQARGLVGSAPAAFLAIGAQSLYVATHAGTITHSSDGGSTWMIRSVSRPGR